MKHVPFLKFPLPLINERLVKASNDLGDDGGAYEDSLWSSGPLGSMAYKVWTDLPMSHRTLHIHSDEGIYGQ